MSKVIVKLTGIKPTGNKISAIKSIRTVTGLGLKEAKDVVDGLSFAPSTIEIDATQLKALDADLTYTFTHVASQSDNRANACESLRAYAKELLDSGKWDAAQNVCNLLSILNNIEDYK